MMVRNVFNGAIELTWNKNILAETVGSDLLPAETHEIVVSSDEAWFDWDAEITTTKDDSAEGRVGDAWREWEDHLGCHWRWFYLMEA